MLRALAVVGIVRDLKDPPRRLLDQARVRDGAFDIGMFRSYWDRAAKVAGRADRRLERPSNRAIGRRSTRTARADRRRPSGAGRHAIEPAKPHPPGAGLRRPVGGRHPPPPDRRLDRSSAHLSGSLRTNRMSRAGAGAEAGDPAAVRAFADARLWIVDLDGVIWLTGQAIGDAAWRRGRTAFPRGPGASSPPTTRRPPVADLLGRLDRIGIAADQGDLASSAHAAAGLFDPGQTVRLLAGDGVREAFDERGVAIAEEGPVDAAVVGWNRTFDFDSVNATAAAARQSGRLVGTNEDPTHPTPDGLVPGSGAILAAVATASGIVPEVAGKPHRADGRPYGAAVRLRGR